MATLTVSQLAGQIQRTLERAHPLVEVQGEIAQLYNPASGHAYLVLRDERATLKLVVWKDVWKQLRRKPGVGDVVVVRGKVSLFPNKSQVQVYANTIVAAGAGALAERFKKTIAKLEAEGLLDPRRKRPLPKFPKRIGVATSLTGAALQDFLRVSRERWPSTLIYVAGCTVQGDLAPLSIAKALERLYDHGKSELIVVTRGGGSREDLLPFMSEMVARWIATGPVPVVSAVGHEIDESIADLVADAVAPTPSAAAALVLPDGPAFRQRIDELELGLQRRMAQSLELRRRRLVRARERLQHPRKRITTARSRLIDLEARLATWAQGAATARKQRLANWKERLHHGISTKLRQERERLARAEVHLRAVSPEAVLERGYALVEGPSGIVRDASSVKPGDAVSVRVATGSFGATVASVPGYSGSPRE